MPLPCQEQEEEHFVKIKELHSDRNKNETGVKILSEMQDKYVDNVMH
jgi:hypothetical protein